jgi:hypothetical protein
VPVDSEPGYPDGSGEDDPSTLADDSDVVVEWVPVEQIPPDGFCWAEVPDPETGRPAELAGLTEEELQALATPAVVPPASWPEGIVPPDGFLSPPPTTTSGPGFGFGEGDPLDRAAAGMMLAGLAEDAHAALGSIDDDCLVGVIRGWRRIASWAAARELAAVAELARRRPDDGLSGSGREYVADELAAALTLTVRTAGLERDLAIQLAHRLPDTLAALAEGRIDLPRARVIALGTAELTPAHAAAVEAAVLPRAPGMTTGQLRAAVAKAVQSADPSAARKQREEAERRAYVSCWTGPVGTGIWKAMTCPRPRRWPLMPGSPRSPPPGSAVAPWAAWTCCVRTHSSPCCWAKTPPRPLPPCSHQACTSPAPAVAPPAVAPGTPPPGTRAAPAAPAAAARACCS